MHRPADGEAKRSIVNISKGGLTTTLFEVRRRSGCSLMRVSHRLGDFVPGCARIFMRSSARGGRCVVCLGGISKGGCSSHILSRNALQLLALYVLRRSVGCSNLLYFRRPRGNVRPFEVGSVTGLLGSLAAGFRSRSLPLERIVIGARSAIFINRVRG